MWNEFGASCKTSSTLFSANLIIGRNTGISYIPLMSTTIVQGEKYIGGIAVEIEDYRNITFDPSKDYYVSVS